MKFKQLRIWLVFIFAVASSLYSANYRNIFMDDSNIVYYPTLYQFNYKGHGLWCGFYAAYNAKNFIEAKNVDEWLDQLQNTENRDLRFAEWMSYLDPIEKIDNNSAVYGATIDAILKKEKMEGRVATIDSYTFLKQILAGEVPNDAIFKVIKNSKEQKRSFAIVFNKGGEQPGALKNSAKRITHWVMVGFWPVDAGWACGIFDSAKKITQAEPCDEQWAKDLCTLCFLKDFKVLEIKARIVSRLESMLTNYNLQLDVHDQMVSNSEDKGLDEATRSVLATALYDQWTELYRTMLTHAANLRLIVAQSNITDSQFLDIVQEYGQRHEKVTQLNEIFNVFFFGTH